MVDVYSLENFENSWRDYTSDGLIDSLFLYDFAEGAREHERRNRTSVRGLLNFLVRRANNTAIDHLHDYAFASMKKQFREIVERGAYDTVIIGYAYWAGLLDSIRDKQVTTVLDMTDFLTLNLFDAYEGKVNFSNLLEEEVRCVALFDKVLCISDEELFFFSRLAKRPEYHYIPISLPAPNTSRPSEYKYDILYIASANPHNRVGMTWFFDKVYPLLSSSYRILVVGEIVQFVSPHANVSLIEHVDDLDSVYRNTRIAICPLLGGTGLKIKVVESLSYGMPVVCTRHGVVGFQSKINNGCSIADDPGAFAGAVELLIENDAHYQQQSMLATSYFRDTFDEEHVHLLLDRVFHPEK
ncbi:MAG: glycosyltransferase [Nitrospiraceae bacterium]|nr:glycosyltransferase [Nitrospiraceae bacterium]